MGKEEPDSLWDRASKAIGALAATLTALATLLALFVDGDGPPLAAIILAVLAIASLAVWSASPDRSGRWHALLPRRVRIATSAALVSLAVAAGGVGSWAILHQDKTRFTVEDVRFSTADNALIADVALTAQQHVLMTEIILAAYYIDPDALIACGGHDYEEIVVTGNSVVEPDANGRFTVEQVTPDSAATSPAVGEITQVGGCSTRASLTLRPQTPLAPGDSGLVRLSVPMQLRVKSATVHETVPGDFPQELRSTPGEAKTMFVDPASVRSEDWDGWQIFYVVQASDTEGRCDREVTQIFPSASEPVTSEEGEALLDRVATTEDTSAWTAAC